MSKRKRQAEQFDVVEFLRESDDDLKSALNSLLRTTPESNETTEAPINKRPGVELEPAVTLSPPLPEVQNAAAPELSSLPILGAGLKLDPLPARLPSDTTKLGPDPKLDIAIPGIKLIADLPLAGGPKKRQFPIREMKTAGDVHTRAEQQVYEYLWQNSSRLDEVSRTITIGFGTLAKIVRLSESNARINLRNLIGKLALEHFGEYHCESSTGRTYRVFDEFEIMKRRREAGLLWYMRRTLAVVFVDPRTGQPLDLKFRPEPILRPGINVGPAESIVRQALSRYGMADEDLIHRLRAETRRLCPDFADEELVHFIHLKGRLLRDTSVASPIGYLLATVPKCLTGTEFENFRKDRREAREREAAEKALQAAEVERLLQEQRAILEDPNVPDEEKRWARKVLGGK